MVFSSFLFVYYFLPVFFAIYWLSPRVVKNYIALAGSLIFYSWGSPKILVILIVSSLFDYLLAPYLANRKKVLIFGIVFNISFLFYYKYSNFLVEQINFLNATFGWKTYDWVKVVLPAGISFFTFEKISYLVDVYRKKAEPSRNFFEYLLFVSLFPHLIAGPILKYQDLVNQIKSRLCGYEDVFIGMTRFCFGLAKKILIADELAKTVDFLFKIDPTELNATYAWLAMVAYSFQIYFDFAGYSDMAIGLARMMGFKFFENFNHPCIATSVTNYWQRWHISLSSWIKEYLYFPLGGNRCSHLRNYINLLVVIFLSGLWHGASWTYITWGIFHGLFLVLDRAFWLKFSEKFPMLINIAITFTIVAISRVVFRADTYHEAAGMYEQLFFGNWNLRLDSYYPAQIIHSRGIFIFLVATFMAFAPAFAFYDKIKVIYSNFKFKDLITFTAAILCLLLSTLAMTEGSFSPFLYFQF